MKRLFRIILFLVLAVSLVAMLLPQKAVAGYRAFVITSASMTPGIRPGSIVVTRPLPPDHYKAGDVVTFISPESSALITHRITAIKQTRGVLVAATKGDANTNGDPWPVAVGAVRGKVVYTIPHLGYGVIALRTVTGFLVGSAVTGLASLLLWLSL